MSIYGSGQGDHHQPQQPGGYGSGGGDYGQQPPPQYGQRPQQPGYQPLSPSVYESAPPPPKKKSKVLPIIGIVMAVLVLLCGGGIFWFLNKASDAVDDAGKQLDAAASALNSTPPAATGTAKPGSSPTDEDVVGDLNGYKKGDCLTINDTTSEVKPAKCTDKGAYKVLLRKEGTTSESACVSVDYDVTLYQDGEGTTDDFVLCMGKVKK